MEATTRGAFRPLHRDRLGRAGAGQSSDPPETFKIGDWVKCLAGLLDVAGVENAHILGLSCGGILSQEFYRRYPSRAQSLVLADTYAGWKGSLPEPICEERLAGCLRDASLPPSELVSKYLPAMHSESASQDVRHGLGSIMTDFHPLGFRLMARSSRRWARNPSERDALVRCFPASCLAAFLNQILIASGALP